MDEVLGIIENEDGVSTVAKHRRECVDIVRGAAPVAELDVDLMRLAQEEESTTITSGRRATRSLRRCGRCAQ